MLSSEPETRTVILEAAKASLIQSGYGSLSTRRIAERAGVPLSQIHYHYGSKQNLLLAVLEEENRRLLERQSRLYSSEMPLWKQWEQACDFLEDDLDSGYVRVLQEMTAAGWSDDEIAEAVRANLQGWMELLADTARAAAGKIDFGPLTPDEVAVLAGAPFFGVEALILLGFEERDLPMRTALRKVGEIMRRLEES